MSPDKKWFAIKEYLKNKEADTIRDIYKAASRGENLDSRGSTLNALVMIRKEVERLDEDKPRRQTPLTSPSY